jgi:hypothetical protein
MSKVGLSFTKIREYFNKLGMYIFFIMSAVCLVLSFDESIPNQEFFLLLSFWFMYSFINQKLNLENIYVHLENLFLVLLDMAVGFAPILVYFFSFIFKEADVYLTGLFIMMICSNLFIKLLVRQGIIE